MGQGMKDGQLFNLEWRGAEEGMSKGWIGRKRVSRTKKGRFFNGCA